MSNSAGQDLFTISAADLRRELMGVDEDDNDYGEEEEYYEEEQVDEQQAFEEEIGEWDDSAILKAFDKAIKEHRSKGSTKPPKPVVQSSEQPSEGPSTLNSSSANHISDAARNRSKPSSNKQAKVKEEPNLSKAVEAQEAPAGAGTSSAAGTSSQQQQPDPYAAYYYAQQYGQDPASQGYYQANGYNNYQQPTQYQQPQAMGPPPIPGMQPGNMPGGLPEDDGLSDLLLAWYYSGYYTGRYQALREMQAKRNSQQ